MAKQIKTISGVTLAGTLPVVIAGAALASSSLLWTAAVAATLGTAAFAAVDFLPKPSSVSE